jgi:hypothetical protein
MPDEGKDSRATVIAMDVTVIWASATTGAFTLAASLGSVSASRRHDAAMRRLDHDHDHLECLQEQRIPVYRHFLEAANEYQLAYEFLAGSWQGLRIWRHRQSSADPDLRSLANTKLAEAQERWARSLSEAQQAIRTLNAALGDVELIATLEVCESARRLQQVIQSLWQVQRAILSPVDRETWRQLRQANEAVESARLQFQHAIRVEIGVGSATNRSA